MIQDEVGARRAPQRNLIPLRRETRVSKSRHFPRRIALALLLAYFAVTLPTSLRRIARRASTAHEIFVPSPYQILVTPPPYHLGQLRYLHR